MWRLVHWSLMGGPCYLWYSGEGSCGGVGWQTPLNLLFNDHFRAEPGLAWLLTVRPNTEHNFSLQLVRWFSTLLSITMQKSRSTICVMVRIQCTSVPSLIKIIRGLTEPQGRWDTRWLCPWAGPPGFFFHLFWKWTFRDQWHVQAGCPSCHPTNSVRSLTQNTDPTQGKSHIGLVLSHPPPNSRSKDRCSLFAGSTTSALDGHLWCTKCNSPAIKAQCTKPHTARWWSLLAGVYESTRG